MKRNSKDNVGDMLHLVEGNIIDEEFLEKYQIDTVVNAAKPSLMGSRSIGSVDSSIHKKIDDILRVESCTFNEKIRQELDKSADSIENEIRCARGEAVITKGYGLCEHIIHVVGTESDAKNCGSTHCSFHRVQKLAECYYNIVEILKRHREIKNIAIPIISSGNYGFNYLYAFRIGVACIGNALIDWKIQDEEFFETAGIRKVYFVLHTDSDVDKRNVAREFEAYQSKFKKNKKVVYQSSFKTHFQILKDIRCNDQSRGYFLIAKWTRYFLMLLRTLFFPCYCFKECLGKIDLSRRRCVVETLTVFKAIFPLIIYTYIVHTEVSMWKVNVAMGILVFCMLDTITYLMTLVLLADIQPPSANIIRSMLLFFVNYLEVVLETSVLYFLYYSFYMKEKTNIQEAIDFGVFGNNFQFNDIGVLSYVHEGTKFFFLTVMFGFLAIHVKPKKFMT